jgi:hypothetical protein
VINQSLPARTATIKPHHVGVHAGLVDKDQLGRIKQALLADPFAGALAPRPCASVRRPVSLITVFDGGGRTI